MRSAQIFGGVIVIAALVMGPAFADQPGHPAGTPHGFTDVQETITYTIVRIDPSRLLAAK